MPWVINCNRTKTACLQCILSDTTHTSSLLHLDHFEMSIVFAETCRIMIKHVKSAALWKPRHFSTEPDLTGGMVGFGNPNFENAPPRKDDDSVGKPKDFWGACLNEQNRKGWCLLGHRIWMTLKCEFLLSEFYVCLNLYFQYAYLWVWDSQICTPTFWQHSLKHSRPEAKVFNKAMSSTMSAVSYLQSKVPWRKRRISLDFRATTKNAKVEPGRGKLPRPLEDD